MSKIVSLWEYNTSSDPKLLPRGNNSRYLKAIHRSNISFNSRTVEFYVCKEFERPAVDHNSENYLGEVVINALGEVRLPLHGKRGLLTYCEEESVYAVRSRLEERFDELKNNARFCHVRRHNYFQINNTGVLSIYNREGELIDPFPGILRGSPGSSFSDSYTSRKVIELFR